MRFRKRFGEVIARQLELFAADNARLLERIAEARDAYVAAPRNEAEARFGEYQAWVVDGTDALARLRDTYASSLDDSAEVEYRDAFNRAVRRRFGDLALELEEDEPDKPF
jgi:hypothetical protein